MEIKDSSLLSLCGFQQAVIGKLIKPRNWIFLFKRNGHWVLISCKEESRKPRGSIKKLCPVSTVASPLTSIAGKGFGSGNILWEASSLNCCHEQMSFLYWEWILLNCWNKGLCPGWLLFICRRHFEISPTVYPGSGSFEPWRLVSGPKEHNSQKGERGGDEGL